MIENPLMFAPADGPVPSAIAPPNGAPMSTSAAPHFSAQFDHASNPDFISSGLELDIISAAEVRARYNTKNFFIQTNLTKTQPDKQYRRDVGILPITRPLAAASSSEGKFARLPLSPTLDDRLLLCPTTAALILFRIASTQ